MARTDRDRAEAILRGSAWLQGQPDDLIEALLAQGRLVRLNAGEWVQAEGDDETGVTVVVEGAVQILCQAPGDREVLIGQVPAGVALGQTMRFGGGPRLVTLVCVAPTVLLRISDHVLARIAADRPQVWEAVSALLYLQLRNLLQMLSQAVALPPRERVAARLLLLSGGGALRSLQLSQQALAEMVGLTRKTVNGFLGEFEGAGLVRRAYGAIEVTDPRGLQRLVDG